MSYHADKLWIDTQTDTHTDAGNDNTRRPKLASGKNLKSYNEEQDFKVYINEELTAARAKLFFTVRKLQKQKDVPKYGPVTVTYAKDLQGSVKPVNNADYINKCLPNVTIK